jgi:hypothetical protein
VNNDELWGGDPDTDYPCNFEAEILAVSGISSYLKRPLPAYLQKLVVIKKALPTNQKVLPEKSAAMPANPGTGHSNRPPAPQVITFLTSLPHWFTLCSAFKTN